MHLAHRHGNSCKLSNQGGRGANQRFLNHHMQALDESPPRAHTVKDTALMSTRSRRPRKSTIPAPHRVPTSHRHIAPLPFHVSRPFSPFLLYFTAFIHYSTPPRMPSVITFLARSPVRRCATILRPFVTLLYLDAHIRSASAAFYLFYSTFTSYLCSRTFPPFYAIRFHTFYIQIMIHKVAIKTL